MTKQYLSRSEAAKVLGCDAQSISNYASRGLFEIMKGDKCVYVEKSSFEKFVNEYYETVKAHEDIKSALDKELCDYRAEIARQRKALDEERDRMSAEKDYIAFVRGGFMRSACLELVDILKGDNKKRAQIWNDLISGYSVDNIKDTYGITRTRVRQQIERFLLELRKSAREVFNTRIDNEHLKRRCESQHNDIVTLHKEIDELNATVAALSKRLNIKRDEYGGEDMAVLLKKSLKEISVSSLGLSVRATKVLLCADCNTLYDVVRLEKRKVKCFRNMGKKTVSEIEDFLHDYGVSNFGSPLTFDMTL